MCSAMDRSAPIDGPPPQSIFRLVALSPRSKQEQSTHVASWTTATSIAGATVAPGNWAMEGSHPPAYLGLSASHRIAVQSLLLLGSRTHVRFSMTAAFGAGAKMVRDNCPMWVPRQGPHNRSPSSQPPLKQRSDLSLPGAHSHVSSPIHTRFGAQGPTNLDNLVMPRVRTVSPL